MKSLMDLFQSFVGNMGVYLGRSDAFMAQHFLNRAKVSTTNQQICGERMPQGMWAHVHW